MEFGGEAWAADTRWGAVSLGWARSCRAARVTGRAGAGRRGCAGGESWAEEGAWGGRREAQGVGARAEECVSQEAKEERVCRRGKWSTEFNPAIRQVTQGPKHTECVGDLQDLMAMDKWA